MQGSQFLFSVPKEAGCGSWCLRCLCCRGDRQKCPKFNSDPRRM